MFLNQLFCPSRAVLRCVYFLSFGHSHKRIIHGLKLSLKRFMAINKSLSHLIIKNRKKCQKPVKKNIKNFEKKLGLNGYPFSSAMQLT
ncbi:MAG: hypothetical protein NEHIOOID_01352 [Holosporales bacterium]